MTEFATVAWVNEERGFARQIPVNVIFELDGYKPLGLWVESEHGVDITDQLEAAEYDVLYLKATRHAAESAVEAADMMRDR